VIDSSFEPAAGDPVPAPVPEIARAPAPEPALAPAPPKPSASNLRRRLATAAVVIPPVIYCIVAGGLWALGAVIVMIVLGLREFYQLIEEKGAQPLKGYGIAGGVALPVVAYLGNEYHATVLMTAVLLGVMVAQLGKRQISESLASVSGTFFGVFYVGWLMSHAVVLRQFHDVVAAKWGGAAAASVDPDAGAFYLLFAAVVVVACDAGAYFTGRAYGKRKLAPAVSPGKTVEGAIGGVLAGTLAGALVKLFFDLFWPGLSSGLDWGAATLFGACVAVAGMVGDLVESLLKRDAQTKDTGDLLPGMGGILDRIDSALLGVPVMYYLLLAHTFVRNF
jgi:phosphatidate cytidylyltransferase